MKETFVPIKNFEEYLISNLGRVKTLSRMVRYEHAVTKQEHFRQTEERFLKVQYNPRTGYKFHQLYKNKKMYNKNIHRLVAESFIPKITGFDYVNHLDGNKHNNIIENLEWCTNEYNHSHATKTGLKARGIEIGTSKLDSRSVHAIKWFLRNGVSHSELSKAFLISRPAITLIANQKTWKHIALTNTELQITL